MRYSLILCIAFTFLGCSPRIQSKADTKSAAKDSLSTLSDTYLTQLTKLGKFNGVVLLEKNGDIILRKAYNITTDTSSTLFVTEKSQFDLRSVAKLFAKISLIKLENEGKLKRTDLLEKYFPGFPNGDKITIQHLMDNRSGLPRELGESIKHPIALTADEVVGLAAKEALEFSPGAKEQYSNIGFQLLYHIIGQLHGNSFSGFLESTFFGPLGMNHSGDNFDQDLGRLTEYAYGHFLDDDNKIVCECSFTKNEMKMGNLHSTADDLALFLKQLDQQDYKAITHKGGISHAGGTRGKRAYVERNFEGQYSIIFLTNYDAIPFEKLVHDLQSMLKGQTVKIPEAIDRKSVYVSPSILKKYEGTYDLVDAGHLTLTIKLENDSLYVYQKGINNGVLYPENENTFFADSTSEESVRFVEDKPGEYYILMDFQGVQWKGIKIEGN
jgi:CubicO group peptidase (beta-lactamase class C family)